MTTPLKKLHLSSSGTRHFQAGGSAAVTLGPGLVARWDSWRMTNAAARRSPNVRSHMIPRTFIALATAATLATLPVHAQAGAAESESRDAASAFMGTTNFTIGRIASACLTIVGRPESPQDYVALWQQRNAMYWLATRKYMVKRLDEALASGGTAKRDAVLAEYAAAVRRDGEGAAQSWINRGSREDACRRAISLIDAGALDVTPRVPIHAELEALARWAEQ